MIIGITGTLGAGKGTVVEYLKNRGFRHVAVSDTFLTGEAVKRGLTPDRVTRRDIANEYRAKGPTALMEAVYELAVPYMELGEDVVLEPQHTAAEVDFIKSKGGIEFAVDADLKVRYGRIQKRASAKDLVSYEQFAEEQTHEMQSDDPNKNNLGAAIQNADFIFQNNATKEELFTQVEEVLKKISEKK
jgi:dephospho-CoA kinase